MRNSGRRDRSSPPTLEWPEPPDDSDGGFEPPEDSDDEYDFDDSDAPTGRRRPLVYLKEKIGRHLTWLADLRAGWFVLAVGLYAFLLKPILMALAWAVEVQLLALPPLLSVRPLEWLAAEVAGAIAIPGAVAQFVLLALVLPLACTAGAQLLPLHTFRQRLPSPRLRATIAIVVMGLLYTLAFARLGFFLAGAGLGIVLTWAFEVRRRRETPRRAFFITLGVHALANAAVVLLLVLAGALS